MEAIDPRAELAPRNVVSGAIQQRLAAPDTSGVFLDLRHLDAGFIRGRFPTIVAHLAGIGLDLARDLIPVAPAAHYFMGGIIAGTDGRTSMPGLLAIGEVSCTGVHGANRLASNSLLEGLVFGINAADMITESPLPTRGTVTPVGKNTGVRMSRHNTARSISDLRGTMTTNVGVLRSSENLLHALEQIEAVPIPTETDALALTLRNMAQVARQMAISAHAREESRGGHIRSDFPGTEPRLDGQHQLVRTIDGVLVRSFGPLHQPTTTARA